MMTVRVADSVKPSAIKRNAAPAARKKRDPAEAKEKQRWGGAGPSTNPENNVRKWYHVTWLRDPA